MREDKGFTLLELMVVVSIIGMLAAIAIPAFLGQREKAKLREADILAGDLRKDVQEFYWHTGRFPANNAEAGVAEPAHIRGQYVKSVTVEDGMIVVKFDSHYISDREDMRWAPAIFTNDPTAPLIWSSIVLPPGYNRIDQETTPESNDVSMPSEQPAPEGAQ